MKRFKDYISEANLTPNTIVDVESFKSQIEILHKKYFPLSLCRITEMQISGTSVNVRQFVATSQDECESRILDNDHLNFSYNVSGFDKEKNVTNNMSLRIYQNSIYRKPNPDVASEKYLAMSRNKISFRAVSSSNIDKIIKAIDTGLKNAIDTIKDAYNKKELFDRDADLVKKKKIV